MPCACGHGRLFHRASGGCKGGTVAGGLKTYCACLLMRAEVAHG